MNEDSAYDELEAKVRSLRKEVVLLRETSALERELRTSLERVAQRGGASDGASIECEIDC